MLNPVTPTQGFTLHGGDEGDQLFAIHCPANQADTRWQADMDTLLHFTHQEGYPCGQQQHCQDPNLATLCTASSLQGHGYNKGAEANSGQQSGSGNLDTGLGATEDTYNGAETLDTIVGDTLASPVKS